MKILSKKQTKKKSKHYIPGYLLVEDNKEYFLISKDITKLKLDNFNIKHIGLKLPQKDL
jgi:hypothetical protein